MKNISGTIEAVFFKLGTKNVHHKKNLDLEIFTSRMEY